jgi:hypothetical protein
LGDEEVWLEEADSFARRYSGLRPVRVARGTLMLEREPICIGIGRSIVDDSPVAAMVSVYPHQTRLAEPKEVASEYAKRLSEAGLSCEEERTANLTLYFRNDRLELDISPGTVTGEIDDPQTGWRIDQASFPHPRLVQRLYAALRDEFRQDLKTRERGDSAKARNLVPACVAFLLRKYGIPPRDEIHRRLVEHGLWKPGENSTSAINQLWDYVNNESLVRGPLVDASRTLFYEGYEGYE